MGDSLSWCCCGGPWFDLFIDRNFMSRTPSQFWADPRLLILTQAWPHAGFKDVDPSDIQYIGPSDNNSATPDPNEIFSLWRTSSFNGDNSFANASFYYDFQPTLDTNVGTSVGTGGDSFDEGVGGFVGHLFTAPCEGGTHWSGYQTKVSTLGIVNGLALVDGDGTVTCNYLPSTATDYISFNANHLWQWQTTFGSRSVGWDDTTFLVHAVGTDSFGGSFGNYDIVTINKVNSSGTHTEEKVTTEYTGLDLDEVRNTVGDGPGTADHLDGVSGWNLDYYASTLISQNSVNTEILGGVAALKAKGAVKVLSANSSSYERVHYRDECYITDVPFGGYPNCVGTVTTEIIMGDVLGYTERQNPNIVDTSIPNIYGYFIKERRFSVYLGEHDTSSTSPDVCNQTILIKDLRQFAPPTPYPNNWSLLAGGGANYPYMQWQGSITKDGTPSTEVPFDSAYPDLNVLYVDKSGNNYAFAYEYLTHNSMTLDSNTTKTVLHTASSSNYTAIDTAFWTLDYSSGHELNVNGSIHPIYLAEGTSPSKWSFLPVESGSGIRTLEAGSDSSFTYHTYTASGTESPASGTYGYLAQENINAALFSDNSEPLGFSDAADMVILQKFAWVGASTYIGADLIFIKGSNIVAVKRSEKLIPEGGVEIGDFGIWGCSDRWVYASIGMDANQEIHKYRFRRDGKVQEYADSMVVTAPDVNASFNVSSSLYCPVRTSIEDELTAVPASDYNASLTGFHAVVLPS